MKHPNFELIAFGTISVLLATANVQANESAQTEAALQRLKDLQTCFANINPKSIEELKQKALSAETEIKALCAAGKRNAAEDFLHKFRLETENSEFMRQTKKCSQGLKDTATNTPKLFSDKKKHICDR